MKTFADINMEDVQDSLIEYVMRTLRCHEIGIIQSFDPNTSLAIVQIARKEISAIDNETIIDIAPLIDVPVFVVGGMNSGIQYPISAGDECLLLFMDRDFVLYYLNKNIAAPDTPITHDFKNAIALIMKLARNDYTNSRTSLTNYLGASINLDDKVNIMNNAQSLITCITELMTAINNLGDAIKNGQTDPVVPGNPAKFDAATQTNIETALSDVMTSQNHFNELLK